MAKHVMEIFFRPIAILIELAIVMGLIYSLFTGGKFLLFELGLNREYSPFVKWVLWIMAFLALIFFAAHLITFYPKISPPVSFLRPAP